MNTTHCQICARDIKAKTGVIAHHGYQRPGNGWQTSSCLGARYASYEESRNRIPQVIDIYKNMLESNKTSLDDLLNNPPATIIRYARYGFQEDQTYERPESFNPQEALKQGSWSYQQYYEMEYKDRYKNFKRNIEGLTSEIEWLQERYDSWVSQ